MNTKTEFGAHAPSIRRGRFAKVAVIGVAVPGSPALLLSNFDLGPLGYTTNEFFVSGTASAYKLAGAPKKQRFFPLAVCNPCSQVLGDQALQTFPADLLRRIQRAFRTK